MFKKNRKVMVVAAHPDDEILGLGGTLIKHIDNGDEIHVLILTNGQDSRSEDAHLINSRLEAAKNTAELVGFSNLEVKSFKDQKLDQYPLIEITQEIEKFALKVKPNIVYIHHHGDANKDHSMVFEASMPAFRPTRQSYLKLIASYETPSSTEWGINPDNSFYPNYFVDISKYINAKVAALNCYEIEMRPSPHPRSKEMIMARAQYWGNFRDSKYAEALRILRFYW